MDLQSYIDNLAAMQAKLAHMLELAKRSANAPRNETINRVALNREFQQMKREINIIAKALEKLEFPEN